MNLKPSDIYFSQDSINNRFGDYTPHSSTLIGETLDALCEGRCSVTDIPTISVVNRGGKWVTGDNRRLWVFRQLEKLGKCNGILVEERSYIPLEKCTSYNGGVSIEVRRNPGGRWFSKSVTKPTDSRCAINRTVPDEQRRVDFETRLRHLRIGSATARQPEALGRQSPVQTYTFSRRGTLGATQMDQIDARHDIHRRVVHKAVNRNKDILLVAAIDFGTTNSGYAFSFRSDFLKDPLKIRANKWNTGAGTSVAYKAPTCILFNRFQQFDSFGFEAEEKYAQLASNGNHREWFFFKRFKMMLYENDNLNRTSLLKDDKGQTMQAMRVFTECIRYLKRHLIEACTGTQAGIREDDIHWVLTVPAIFDESAKQFMREAAIDAGIRTACLSLALEPEAASMFCQHRPALTAEDDDEVTNVLSLEPETKYLVLDAGGGTVDITVHEIRPNHNVKELYNATGGPFGGTNIDNAFLSLLTDVFGKETIDILKEDNKEDYLGLVRDFEIKKGRIHPDLDQKFTFKMPTSIQDAFRVSAGHVFSNLSIKSDLRNHITLTMDKLRVEPNVAKDLFKTTCNQIVRHLSDIFHQPEVSGVDTIVMVGGFSESKMLQDAIQRNFLNKTVVIPEEAGLAVLKGAVIFGHKPEAIASRVSRFTYGIRAKTTFIPEIHALHRLKDRDGRQLCTDCFSKHVEIGQEVKVGKALKASMYTFPKHTIKGRINIYRSNKHNPLYTDDAGCSYIGKLDVDLSNVDTNEKIRVAVRMIFGETELGVESGLFKTGKNVKAKFDFLG